MTLKFNKKLGITPSSGGTTINNQDISVTENGTYTADEGYTGLGTVEVEVPAPVIESLTVTPTTSAQTITAPSGVDGYSPITVNAVEGKKYNLFDRVKDDSNNEIGTVSGFFTDTNNVEYAVVCLDASYRNVTQWTTVESAVPNMPTYTISQFQKVSPFNAPETATENTDYILSFESSENAAAHCRSKSAVIDGVTYYGQFPNFPEMIDIVKNSNKIDALDITLSSYRNYRLKDPGWAPMASTQLSANGDFRPTLDGTYMIYTGFWESKRKVIYGLACPVLEIPNQ